MEIKETLNLLNSEEFTVLDIETSGLSPAKGGRIIEIGAVKVKNKQIIDEFHTLVYPEQKIYTKTTELTGITNEMLEGQPVYGQVLPKLYEFIGDSVIVAHNVKFDWDRFLLFFFKKVGMNPINKVIDTMDLSKHFYKNKKKHNLAEMCNELSVNIGNHHRANDDAKATAKCLIRFIEMYKLTYNGDQIGIIKDNTEISREVKANEIKLKVRKVNYWEKQVTKKKLMQRLYVSINDGRCYGMVYYDIPSKTWYNKDFPVSVNFEKVHKLVLSFLNLNSTEELCNWNNKKNQPKGA
ncbi:TPA: 3'-5' exoribonuclease [Clostridium botulinum]|nr:3'-5' exoribonuclease [Clostridium botulinum]